MDVLGCPYIFPCYQGIFPRERFGLDWALRQTIDQINIPLARHEARLTTISSVSVFLPNLLPSLSSGLLKMGEGACFGMPTPEREAVSAPSWGTGLRPHSDYAPAIL